MSLLIDYTFQTLNIHNIMIRVYAFNTRAQRSYEKIGFKLIGRRREALLRNRNRHDIIIMDIMAEDFYKTK